MHFAPAIDQRINAAIEIILCTSQFLSLAGGPHEPADDYYRTHLSDETTPYPRTHVGAIGHGQSNVRGADTEIILHPLSQAAVQNTKAAKARRSVACTIRMSSMDITV